MRSISDDRCSRLRLSAKSCHQKNVRPYNRCLPAGAAAVAFVKSDEGVVGYILSKGSSDYRIRIGDLPERCFPQAPAKA